MQPRARYNLSMGKKVAWPEPKISSAKVAGTYRSMKEAIRKSNEALEEQRLAQEYLRKAEPAMNELFKMRVQNGTPLTVMRPLTYRTSVLNKSGEDDGFYNNPQPAQAKFVDDQRTIMPGTQLILKSIDPTLREFIFNDPLGKEHPISFDDKHLLMTQTDVFETVRQLIDGGR